MNFLVRSMAICALTLLPGPAGAADTGDTECDTPCFEYTINSEVDGDWIIGAKPRNLEKYDIGPSSTMEGTLTASDNISFYASVTTEQVLDRDPLKNRIFKDIGTYVGALYTDVSFDPLTLRLGKFDPDFSLASANLEGRNAADLVGNLDTIEKLGAALSADFEAFGLEHTLTASAFTTDRTVLSRSLFTDRGRTTLADGGAGNTNDLSSIAVILDGCSGKSPEDCYSDGDFGYRLAARYQAAGKATEDQVAEKFSPKDELAVLAAASWRHEIADETAFRLLGELSYVNHFETSPDDALIATVAAQYEAGPLKLDASYTLQNNIVANGKDAQEHLVDVSLGYELGEDVSLAGEAWTASASYGYAKSGEETAHSVGITLSAELSGKIPLSRH